MVMLAYRTSCSMLPLLRGEADIPDLRSSVR
jgi:hypothetical protein